MTHICNKKRKYLVEFEKSISISTHCSLILATLILLICLKNLRHKISFFHFPFIFKSFHLRPSFLLQGDSRNNILQISSCLPLKFFCISLIFIISYLRGKIHILCVLHTVPSSIKMALNFTLHI